METEAEKINRLINSKSESIRLILLFFGISFIPFYLQFQIGSLCLLLDSNYTELFIGLQVLDYFPYWLVRIVIIIGFITTEIAKMFFMIYFIEEQYNKSETKKTFFLEKFGIIIHPDILFSLARISIPFIILSAILLGVNYIIIGTIYHIFYFFIHLF